MRPGVNGGENTKRFGQTGLRFLGYYLFSAGLPLPHRGIVLVVAGGALCQMLFTMHALSHLTLATLLSCVLTVNS